MFISALIPGPAKCNSERQGQAGEGQNKYANGEREGSVCGTER
jgi:hypothetical protein